MMRRKLAVAAGGLVLALVAAACSGGDDGNNGGAAAPPAAQGDRLALKGVCPDTIVLQTDWVPEAEHGAMYQLLGSNTQIDAGKKRISGPLVASGKDTGVR
jgi:ABC-type glycerol-3-phosphate transport system substrate-binding protein